MKVKVNKPEPKFQPIELTITIESQRELEFLWALFNTNDKDLCDMVNDHTGNYIKKFTEIPFNSHSIWKELGGTSICK